MKLSLEMHGLKTIIEEDRDDYDVFEMAVFLRNILLAQGFHPESVDKILAAE